MTFMETISTEVVELTEEQYNSLEKVQSDLEEIGIRLYAECCSPLFNDEIGIFATSNDWQKRRCSYFGNVRSKNLNELIVALKEYAVDVRLQQL